MQYPIVFKKPTPKKYTNYNLLRNILFGNMLDPRQPQNSLGQTSETAQVLAEVNNRCGIIESLTLQGLMKTAHVQLKSHCMVS